jgi:hypothetical protein
MKIQPRCSGTYSKLLAAGVTRFGGRLGDAMVRAPVFDHLTTRRHEMKRFRAIVIFLAWTCSALLIVQTATASEGIGGKGKAAAVGIDTILLINPDVPGGNVRAEISGGGFLVGDFLEVTLDGNALAVEEASADMLIVTIPKNTADGDHDVTVSTGFEDKQSASATISLGGTMIVSCISWFVSGPADEHIHTEVHVEDEYGEPVIGAMVVWTAENETVGVYQTNASPTYDNDGHAGGENCVNPVSGSGVTDWFCCIGAGKWDGETPPGKRACDEAFRGSPRRPAG